MTEPAKEVSLFANPIAYLLFLQVPETVVLPLYMFGLEEVFAVAQVWRKNGHGGEVRTQQFSFAQLLNLPTSKTSGTVRG